MKYYSICYCYLDVIVKLFILSVPLRSITLKKKQKQELMVVDEYMAHQTSNSQKMSLLYVNFYDSSFII